MKSMFDDGSFNDTESKNLNKTNKTAFEDVLKLQGEAQNSVAGTS